MSTPLDTYRSPALDALVGATTASGEFELVEPVVGSPERSIFLAKRPGETGARFSATVALLPHDGGHAWCATPEPPVPGVAARVWVGPLAADSWSVPLDVLIEVQPPGEPSDTAFDGPVSANDAIVLGRGLAATAAIASTLGIAVGGLRPERIMILEEEGSPRLSGILNRSERFWDTAGTMDVAVPPTFSSRYQPWESLPEEPPISSGDVFAIACVVATWVLGEHPFGPPGEQAAAMTRGWEAPAELGGTLGDLLEAAMHPSPGRRPSAGALRDGFGAC